MDFSLPLGMCPKCQEENINVYATRAKGGGAVCSRGHAFESDIDFYKGITKIERKRMDKSDKRMIDKVISGTISAPSIGEIPAIEVEHVGDIHIDEVSKARLTSLVGEFNDVSTLVGRIFALNEEKKDLEDMIKKARKIKVGEEDGKIIEGGDLKFEGIIPERHVQPLMDLAHSWSSNVTRYVNERLSTLLDDMLFY